MAHDVFISYSTKDKTVADTVCAKLEEQRIRCWIAPRDIAPGQHFAKSIIDAIDACKVFILIWSANSNLSEHILNEIQQAFDQGITIVPFRIEDVKPNSEMRYFLGRTHWLDALTPPLEKHVESLATTILATLGRPAAEQIPNDAIPIQANEKDEKAIKETPQVKPVTNPKEEPPLLQETREEGARKKFSPTGKNTGKKRYLPVFGAAGLIVVTLALFFTSGKLKGLSTTEKTQTEPKTSITTFTAVPTRRTTFTPRVTSTASKTFTATAIPAWVNDFAAPILAAVADIPPYFQDDFSSNLYGWSLISDGDRTDMDCSKSVTEIAGGSLRLGPSPDPQCFARADLWMQLGNYVLQIDLDFRSMESTDMKIDIATGLGDNFGLRKNGDWEIVDMPEWNNNFMLQGNIAFDATLPVKITFISYEKRNAVYVNDIPVHYLTMDEPAVKNELRLGVGYGWEGSSNIGIFDNLKIWDLNLIENIATLIK